MENNKTYNFEDIKNFLNNHKEDYKDYQVYCTRNLVGDPMKTVYSKDGVTIDECRYYGYLEIFRLDKEDFEKICDMGCLSLLKI